MYWDSSETPDFAKSVKSRRLIVRNSFLGDYTWPMLLLAIVGRIIWAKLGGPESPPAGFTFWLVMAGLGSIGAWWSYRVWRSYELVSIATRLPATRERVLDVAEALGCRIERDNAKFARFYLYGDDEFGSKVVTTIFASDSSILFNVRNLARYGNRWPLDLRERGMLLAKIANLLDGSASHADDT